MIKVIFHTIRNCSLRKKSLILLIFSHFFLNIPWNEIIWSEAKLFHSHRIFKNGAGREVRANPLNPLWFRNCHETVLLTHPDT